MTRRVMRIRSWCKRTFNWLYVINVLFQSWVGQRRCSLSRRPTAAHVVPVTETGFQDCLNPFRIEARKIIPNQRRWKPEHYRSLFRVGN
jgi:hypothetical protein